MDGRPQEQDRPEQDGQRGQAGRRWPVMLPATGLLVTMAAVLVMCGPGAGGGGRAPAHEALPSPAPGPTQDWPSLDSLPPPPWLQSPPPAPAPLPDSVPAAAPTATAAPAPAEEAVLPPAAGSLCERAERLGQWSAGSEQADLCHGVYG